MRGGLRGLCSPRSENPDLRHPQLPEWMHYRHIDFPSPVPNCEGPGAPSTLFEKITETGATRLRFYRVAEADLQVSTAVCILTGSRNA